MTKTNRGFLAIMLSAIATFAMIWAAVVNPILDQNRHLASIMVEGFEERLSQLETNYTRLETNYTRQSELQSELLGAIVRSINNDKSSSEIEAESNSENNIVPDDRYQKYRPLGIDDRDLHDFFRHNPESFNP